MSKSTLERAKEIGEAGGGFVESMLNIESEREEAAKITDQVERDKKNKELDQKERDAERDAMLGVTGQVFDGKTKQGVDAGLHLGSILRDRISNDKDIFPSYDELTKDPAGKKTSIQTFGSKMSELEGIANSLGYGKEFKALKTSADIADLVDRYGLGDASFKDMFGTADQLKAFKEALDKGTISSLGLSQLGQGLANLQVGLDMFANFGNLFGFGKEVGKIKAAVAAAQGIVSAFNGDVSALVDSLFSLEAFGIKLPPALKQALKDAKELYKALKPFENLKPVPSGAPGVFAVSQQVARKMLSGTAHGIMLIGPGTGSLNVLVDKMPAWRCGPDLHMCPLPIPPGPHGPGPTVPGQATVLVNKVPVARHTDKIMEPGGGPTPIVPGPVAAAIAAERAAKEAAEKAAKEKAAKDKAAKDKAAKDKAAKDGAGKKDGKRGPLTREEREQRKKDLQARRDREARAEERNKNAKEQPKRPLTEEEKNRLRIQKGLENFKDPKKWEEFGRKMEEFGYEVAKETFGDLVGAVAGNPGEIKDALASVITGPAKVIVRHGLQDLGYSPAEAEAFVSGISLGASAGAGFYNSAKQMANAQQTMDDVMPGLPGSSPVRANLPNETVLNTTKDGMAREIANSGPEPSATVAVAADIVGNASAEIMEDTVNPDHDRKR